MTSKNMDAIIDTMKDKEYLLKLKIGPQDVIKAVKLAQKEFDELNAIVKIFNNSKKSLQTLCDILKGHNFSNAKYPDHNYFDLNYKSLLVTIIQPINENGIEEPMRLSKDQVYVYPDNITKEAVDEMFVLNFNESIDFEKINERFNNQEEEEELEEQE